MNLGKPNIIKNFFYSLKKIYKTDKIFVLETIIHTIISALVVFMYIDTIIDGILKGLGEHTSVMLVNIIDLTITTSFIYLFVPKLGIIGYIISIYISEVVNLSISFIKLLFLLKRH